MGIVHRLFPPAFFMLFALLLCAPVLLGKVPVASETFRIWAPWNRVPGDPVTNTAIADSTLLFLPWHIFARGAVADGEWPLWDPNTFGGFPFAANSQNQGFYPVTWIGWLLPLSGVIQLLTLSSIFFAGWGMYLLSKELGVSRAGGLLAGLAFAGSGMMQLSINVPIIAATYAWLPWVLFSAERAMGTRSLRWTAGAALFVGIQAVAGNLQWLIYTLFALACRVVWLAVGSVRREGWRRAAGMLGRGAAIGAVGLALAAAHLAPFVELASQSTRTGVRVSSNSWPPEYLLRLLMPQFFGDASPAPGEPTVGAPMVFSDLWYVGVAPLALGLAAVALRWRKALFWAGPALLALLVTYGVGPFLYARWLPGLSSLLPQRIGYLFIAAVAVLAGLGYDAWAQLARERKRQAILLLGMTALALAAVFAAAWAAANGTEAAELRAVREQELWRSGVVLALGAAALALFAMGQRSRLRGAAGTVLVLAVAVDLAASVPGYSSFVEPDEVVPRSQTSDWLGRNAQGWRVMPVDSPEISFNPNSHLAYGIASVDGYDSLHTERVEDFWRAVDPSIVPAGGSLAYTGAVMRPQAFSSTLASLLGVRYVATAGEMPEGTGLRKVFTGEIGIYERLDALPRAFMLERAEALPREEVYGRLAVPNFDPLQGVLLEAEEEPPISGTEGAPGEAGRAEVVSLRRNSVEVEVDAARAGWLVLTEPNYPGWRASVDGREAPIFTAYGLVRAVAVEAGRNRVVFEYTPSAMLAAGVVSLGALALVGLGLALGGGKPRRLRGRNLSDDEGEGERRDGESSVGGKGEPGGRAEDIYGAGAKVDEVGDGHEGGVGQPRKPPEGEKR